MSITSKIKREKILMRKHMYLKPKPKTIKPIVPSERKENQEKISEDIVKPILFFLPSMQSIFHTSLQKGSRAPVYPRTLYFSLKALTAAKMN